MGSISLRGVSVLTPDPLFRELTFVVGEADRIGLVAGNGAGKTTLLRCLAGVAEPSTGEIVRSRGLRVGIVEQDVPSTWLDLPLVEIVRRGLPASARDSDEWRVDLVLDEFDTPADMRKRPLRVLSGGWQRLALIARTWVAEPDALLLDEPTNHLDLEKIRLLEDWLTSPMRRVPMVIASHDRRFLDSCTNRTLFLRPEMSRSYSHPFTAARRLLANDDATQEARFAKDAREADRLRRSAGELKNIGINSLSDAAQKKAAQIYRRAEALERTLKPAHVEKAGDIRLANRGTHARVMLALDNVTVRTPDGRALFAIGKLSIAQGERVVVLGRNGAGKSRFVALLREAIAKPDNVAGVRVNAALALGYVDQAMSHLPGEKTPLSFITETFRPGDQRATSLLAGAGFPLDRQRRPIATLSPGQKARLGLLALRLANPNFYLMDEPTNHVDIVGQERLEQEILAHEATCVLVSHDRHFVSSIGTRFLLVEKGAMREVEEATGFSSD